MGDEEKFERMRADLLRSARLGIFEEVSGVVLATVKLERLKRRKGAARTEYDRLAERMFGAVRDELQARARA